MSAIYELKNQIYSDISDITCKIFINSKDTDVFYQEEKQVNKYLGQLSKVKTQFNLNLDIKDIKFEKSDIKNYFYGIGFELYLYINNNYCNDGEKIVYNIIERILKLLSAMEFYYCYKLNNHDIKSEIDIQTEKLKEVKIKVNWITHLYVNNNLFN